MPASMPFSAWKTAFAVWSINMKLKSRIEELERQAAEVARSNDERTIKRLIAEFEYRDFLSPLPRLEEIAVYVADMCEKHGRKALEEGGINFDFDRWLKTRAELSPAEVVRYRAVLALRQKCRMFPFHNLDADASLTE